MLQRFLLVSALAHAALLVVVPLAPRELPRLAAPELQLSIAAPAAEPQRRASEEPLQTPTAAATPAPAAVTASEPVRPVATAVPAMRHTAAQRPRRAPPSRATPATHAADSPPSHLLALLRMRLQEYFVYPPLARKRGWQGDVRIDVRLEADGRIKPLRVVRSSGHSVLDRDALDTLARLGTLPQARGLLGGHSYAFELPVSYRLTEG
jgi:protein TonB